MMLTEQRYTAPSTLKPLHHQRVPLCPCLHGTSHYSLRDLVGISLAKGPPLFLEQSRVSE